MGKTDVPDVVAATQSIARLDFNKHKHELTAILDRGDPALPDWELGDLTDDASFRDLDCSSVVGAKETFVLLTVFILAGEDAGALQFRKKGHTHFLNATGLDVGPGELVPYSSHIVGTNSEGIIQYLLTPADWNRIDITIRAWSE